MSTPTVPPPAAGPSLHQLKTPRAAALAGVLSALLLAAVLILIRAKMPEGDGDPTPWLNSEGGNILTATKLAIMFVSTSVAAALVASNAVITDPAAHAEVIAFGKLIVVSAAKTYAIRMAAVFMMSLATIWLKTGLMPRWLVGITYLTALALLIGSDVSMWLTLTFPIWMLVVSGLLLTRAEFIDPATR